MRTTIDLIGSWYNREKSKRDGKGNRNNRNTRMFEPWRNVIKGH